MRQNYSLLLLLVLFVFSVGCKKFNKPEKATSYIYIPSIRLQVSSIEGTASNAIKDAWVYVNEQPVGVLELPCLVPVLAEGKQKIAVYAGIMDDGINERRNKYLFYQPFVTYDVNLTPGKVDTLKGALEPVVTYYPSTEIEIWNENFDDASINFVAETNSDAGITYVNDINFEGAGVGKIELSPSMSFARVRTSQTFNLPKGGNPVYVEINYNTNNTMAIGIQAKIGTDNVNIDNTVIRASGGVWKKMYVNLTDVVSQQGNSTEFKFIITMTKDNGVSTAINYIDNFKVVYAK